MTAIIGVETDKGVYLGADSLMTNCCEMSLDGRKLFQVENFAVALTGSNRVIQVMKYGKKRRFQPIHSERDVFRFGARLRKVLDKDCKGFGGGAHDRNFALLLATQCGLYVLYETGEFHHEPSWGMGVGGSFALGHVRGMLAAGEKPKRAIRKSLAETARYNVGVGGPAQVIRI